MKLLLIALIIFLTPIHMAHGDQCQEQACISVYTENNQIIIVARKGNTTATQKISQVPKKPVVKSTPKPKPVPLFFPPKTVVVPKPIVSKPRVKRSYKPRTTKAVTSVNLSDRLIKMVPTAGVAYQPEFEPLSNVPVYFWCDLPTLFQSRVDIIGEVVDVALRPSFMWSFGDGAIYATTENGGPFPNGNVRHSYARPGTYVITLLTTWNGTYTHNAQARAVSGTVKKISVATVTVVAAPTTFKG
jgi:hypothetical protein